MVINSDSQASLKNNGGKSYANESLMRCQNSLASPFAHNLRSPYISRQASQWASPGPDGKWRSTYMCEPGPAFNSVIQAQQVAVPAVHGNIKHRKSCKWNDIKNNIDSECGRLAHTYIGANILGKHSPKKFDRYINAVAEQQMLEEKQNNSNCPVSSILSGGAEPDKDGNASQFGVYKDCKYTYQYPYRNPVTHPHHSANFDGMKNRIMSNPGQYIDSGALLRGVKSAGEGIVYNQELL